MGPAGVEDNSDGDAAGDETGIREEGLCEHPRTTGPLFFRKRNRREHSRVRRGGTSGTNWWTRPRNRPGGRRTRTT